MPQILVKRNLHSFYPQSQNEIFARGFYREH
jgi:hypothetical protein